MNAMLSLLALQENIIPQEGLTKLVFKCWEFITSEKHLVEPLDYSVMQLLLSKC